MAEKPICRSAPTFVKAHANGRGLPDKAAFAPCTGQDRAAFEAFVHLVELYAAADDKGRAHTIAAMASTVLAMQESTRHLAKKAIPAVMDWGDEETLWRKIQDRIPSGVDAWR